MVEILNRQVRVIIRFLADVGAGQTTRRARQQNTYADGESVNLLKRRPPCRITHHQIPSRDASRNNRSKTLLDFKEKMSLNGEGATLTVCAFTGFSGRADGFRMLPVAGPGTPALFIVGLAGMGLTRCKKPEYYAQPIEAPP